MSIVTQPTNYTEQLNSLFYAIRAIESFSHPENNNQQIVGGLVNGELPTSLTYTPNATTGTNGLSTAAGDGRDTPGAYQVDLDNMHGVFGNYNNGAGNAGFDIKEISFSKTVLEHYFGIKVDASGIITEISQASASVFVGNESLASASNFDTLNNSFVGQHIDNYKEEQLSLYLAGRNANDTISGTISISSGDGIWDKREAPTEVLNMAEAIQLDASKAFVYREFQTALSENINNTPDYGSWSNIEALYGTTLKITSSSPAFGINTGEEFYATFNEAFLVGYRYVGGFYGLRDVVKAILDANNNGSSTVDGINITRNVDGSISFDSTPVNVRTEYPSFFHYGALLSQFDIPTFTEENWGLDSTVIDLDYNIGDTAVLGYTSTQTTITQNSGGTLAETTGVGQYNVGYENIDGQTVTITGDDHYFLTSGSTTGANVITVNTDGYTTNTFTALSGDVIDISTFNTSGFGDIEQGLVYRWWDSASDAFVAKSVNDGTIPSAQTLELIYITNTDNSADAILKAENGEVGSFAFIINVADKDVLGTIDANDFIFTSTATEGGSGIIDASSSTGNVNLEVSSEVEQVSIGTGTTFVNDTNETATQYVLNNNMATENPNALLITKFDVENVTDIINIEGFGDIVSDSLSVTTTSFDNKSDESGSSVANFYDQYSYISTVSFQKDDNGTINTYQFQVGASSDNQISDIDDRILNAIQYTTNTATQSTLALISSGIALNVVLAQDALNTSFLLTDNSDIISTTSTSTNTLNIGAYYIDESQLSLNFNNSHFDITISENTETIDITNDYIIEFTQKSGTGYISTAETLSVEMPASETTGAYTFNETYTLISQKRKDFVDTLGESNVESFYSNTNTIYGSSGDIAKLFVNDSQELATVNVNTMKDSNGDDIMWQDQDNAMVQNAYLTDYTITIDNTYTKFLGYIAGNTNKAIIQLDGNNNIIALEDNISQNILQTPQMFNNIQEINGGAGNDIIDLSSNTYSLGDSVTLSGGTGDDILWGGSGNDVINGGEGADQLIGGTGNDMFVYDAISDSNASSGIDEIYDFNTPNDTLQVDSNSFSDNNLFKINYSGEVATLHYDANDDNIIDNNEFQVRIYNVNFSMSDVESV